MMRTGMGRALILLLLMLAASALWAAAGAEEARAAEVKGVVISEVMASNGTYKNSHAYDWIELHNTTGKTVDLSGWALSDSAKSRRNSSFPRARR